MARAKAPHGLKWSLIVAIGISCSLSCVMLATALKLWNPRGICRAAYRGDIDALNNYIKRGDNVETRQSHWLQKDLYELTPLFWAVEGDSAAAINALVGHGAKIDARNVDGLTPLHWALVRSKYRAARALASVGADVNVSLPDGTSPLIVALERGEAGLAELMIIKGADPMFLSPDGAHPLMAALMGIKNDEQARVICIMLGFGLKPDVHIGINMENGPSLLEYACHKLPLDAIRCVWKSDVEGSLRGFVEKALELSASRQDAGAIADLLGQSPSDGARSP